MTADLREDTRMTDDRRERKMGDQITAALAYLLERLERVNAQLDESWTMRGELNRQIAGVEIVREQLKDACESLQADLSATKTMLEEAVPIMNALLDVVYQTRIPDRMKLVTSGEDWLKRLRREPVVEEKGRD